VIARIAREAQRRYRRPRRTLNADVLKGDVELVGAICAVGREEMPTSLSLPCSFRSPRRSGTWAIHGWNH